ncbi:MAG: FAD binding domain-containing protein [Rubrimonas sp.]|uniref:FAD binding domain-containing protein n=1 Tax=Rubrimonas sp. TaxID=2036015 RepID=UPI002FDDC4AD
MTATPRFHRPRALDAALALLAAEAHRGASGDAPRILAGGTDVYPSLRDGPAAFAALDVSGLDALRGASETAEGWRIGAATTWTMIARGALPPAFDALRAAAREVGGAQIQNAGTIGGNLCNASPAADGVPPLLALDAQVELASLRGVRRLPLGDFLLGPRRTARAPDELMTAVLIPPQPEAARSAFVKLGARVHLVISIGMVAALLAPDAQGRVGAARVAVGACSAVAQRLPALEAALVGAPWDGRALAAIPDPAHLAPLSPIDDIRASAAYRRAAALELVRRALGMAAGEAAAA